MRSFNLKSLLDSTLFLVIVATINILWFDANPAFRSWMWHPYLLIIILIALFYGLYESLATVILCEIVYMGLVLKAGFLPASFLRVPDSLHLLSFLLVGLLFGEVGEIYQRTLSRVKEKIRSLDIGISAMKAFPVLPQNTPVFPSKLP